MWPRAQSRTNLLNNSKCEIRLKTDGCDGCSIQPQHHKFTTKMILVDNGSLTHANMLRCSLKSSAVSGLQALIRGNNTLINARLVALSTPQAFAQRQDMGIVGSHFRHLKALLHLVL